MTGLSFPIEIAGMPGVLLNSDVVVYTSAALTATVVYAISGAKVLRGIVISNTNTSTAYVQVFDATSGVTLGTTAPKQSYGVRASTGYIVFPNLSCATGLALAATTTATGNTAPSSNLTVAALYA